MYREAVITEISCSALKTAALGTEEKTSRVCKSACEIFSKVM